VPLAACLPVSLRAQCIWARAGKPPVALSQAGPLHAALDRHDRRKGAMERNSQRDDRGVGTVADGRWLMVWSETRDVGHGPPSFPPGKWLADRARSAVRHWVDRVSVVRRGRFGLWLDQGKKV
jgi:hypothetical protein